MAKDTIFMSSESQMERRKRAGLKKVLKEITAKKFPRFGKDVTTDLRNLVPKQRGESVLGLSLGKALKRNNYTVR